MKKKTKSKIEGENLLTAKDKAFASTAKMAGGGQIWKPAKEGDGISGTLVSLKEQQGKFGPQMVALIKTPAGDTRMVYANKSVAEGLEQSKAKVGMKVIIVFKGEVKTGKGKPFRTYAVAAR